LLLCLLPVLALSCAVHASDPPNIILILVDDLGYGDLGCYGNKKIKTPRIDELAAEGQRWTSFYSSGPTCVPSRRGLVTGRHPALMAEADLAKSRDRFLSAMLKKQGYATALLGKWHLEAKPKEFATNPLHPLDCGFDSFYGTAGSNDVPAPPGKIQNRELFDSCDKFTFPVPLFRGREAVEKTANQELFTKRYTREAVRWIKAKKGERFFLLLSHNMPHVPLFASRKFRGKSEGGRYGDVVEELDWSVGRVVDAVKAAGIDEKTLIVFTSDNGPWSVFEVHGGTAGSLRGEKGTTWEGGVRVPAIFRWPGRIAPGEVDGMAAGLDLYATFATLAGGTQPRQETGYISQDLSGVLLRGEASPRTRWFYSGHTLAFRSGNYKIHLSTKARSTNPETRKRAPVARHDPPLLFDLESDPGEQTNIAAERPEIVARLLAELDGFRRAD
jgi:arylsulfatase A-like enzyme